MKQIHYPKLVTSILCTVGFGLLGGLFTANETDTWYATLNKPFFTPPGWLFAPVWTVLYLLMGISLYLVWNRPPSPDRAAAIAIFIVQYVLNFCWPLIFFKLHLPGWALIEIIVLWVLIVFTVVYFNRVSATAAWLLAPYLAWVSFAKILNGALFWMNSGMIGK